MSKNNPNTEENNEPLNNSLKIAILVEIIHCISLVLDDLPEMDNDDFRRDNLSFHKKRWIS